MNHVYVNGEASPCEENVSSLKSLKRKFKNEYKGSSFIAIKHMIENTIASTYSDTCILTEVYMNMRSESEQDKEMLKQMLTEKFNQLFK